MSSTVSPVVIASPTQITPQKQKRQLCFTPLISECKELASNSPVLFSGLITSLGSFFGSLCSKNTLKFLPATFIPTLLTLLYDLVFPESTVKNNNGPSILTNDLTERVAEEERMAA